MKYWTFPFMACAVYALGCFVNSSCHGKPFMAILYALSAAVLARTGKAMYGKN